MTSTKQISYWITLAHIPKWTNEKINNLLIKLYNNNVSLEDFFCDINQYSTLIELPNDDIVSLKNQLHELPKSAFLAEELYEHGFEVIPIMSDNYSQTLKSNLKLKSPPLLYIKGNKNLLNKDSVAVVGARNASEYSLSFTDNIVKQFSNEYKVVVSGFAKGVDQQALESALKYKGQSIIVLPQGIMTFGSGIRKYYTQIVEGDVLVLSAFHPKVPWQTKLAIGRNTFIYGLAKNIYVAESNDSGGTWSGCIDGLKKGRTIFVRQADADEKNANNILIEKGATAVDFDCSILEQPNMINKQEEINAEFEIKLKELLLKKPLTAKEILLELKLELTVAKLSKDLAKISFLEKKKVKTRIYYQLKNINPMLFGED